MLLLFEYYATRLCAAWNECGWSEYSSKCDIFKHIDLCGRKALAPFPFPRYLPGFLAPHTYPSTLTIRASLVAPL